MISVLSTIYLDIYYYRLEQWNDRVVFVTKLDKREVGVGLFLGLSF